jgi:hypothetical protein
VDFRSHCPSDAYIEPLLAEADWWKDLMVENIMVVVGTDEVLLDGIKSFTCKLQSGLGEEHVSKTLLDGTSHVACNLDPIFGYDRGTMGTAVEEWLRSKL